MLLGKRFLQGTSASASLTNGGAIIAKMVRQEERGFAVSMYTLGILLGHSVGPAAGWFLAAAKGWRWVFWPTSIVVNLAPVLGHFKN
jgi:MFS family permease